MTETPRRCVWLTHADVSWLHTSEDTPQRREALTRLNIGFNSAPADPVEAIAGALFRVMQMRYPGVAIADPAVTMDAFRAEAKHLALALGWDAA